MQERLQLAQHGTDAAGGVKIRHVVLAGGLEIDEHRRRVRPIVQLMEIDLDPGASGDRGEVNDRVRRAADGEQYPDCVFDRFGGDDLRRKRILG